MGTARGAACAFMALFLIALCGCGQGKPPDGLLSNIDKARAVKTLSSLQQALITASTVQADAGSSPAAFAAALQQRDPSNRYTTTPPTEPGVVQVLGGGGAPVMLVGISSSPSDSRTPSYLALWESAGSTLFYVGAQPPPYSGQPPSGPGWTRTPPQA
jgi:hypothetical protein